MGVARDQGAITIGFTGDQGGQLKELVDLCIQVPSPLIEQQEDIHLIIGARHLLGHSGAVYSGILG